MRRDRRHKTRFCSVDRLEEDKAVLLFDDGEEKVVEKDELPFELREGMVLKQEGGVLSPDEKETAGRRTEAAVLLNKILSKK